MQIQRLGMLGDKSYLILLIGSCEEQVRSASSRYLVIRCKQASDLTACGIYMFI
jgi:hypothetical protein